MTRIPTWEKSHILWKERPNSRISSFCKQILGWVLVNEGVSPACVLAAREGGGFVPNHPGAVRGTEMVQRGMKLSNKQTCPLGLILRESDRWRVRMGESGTLYGVAQSGSIPSCPARVAGVPLTDVLSWRSRIRGKDLSDGPVVS